MLHRCGRPRLRQQRDDRPLDRRMGVGGECGSNAEQQRGGAQRDTASVATSADSHGAGTVQRSSAFRTTRRRRLLHQDRDVVTAACATQSALATALQPFDEHNDADDRCTGDGAPGQRRQMRSPRPGKRRDQHQRRWRRREAQQRSDCSGEQRRRLDAVRSRRRRRFVHSCRRAGGRGVHGSGAASPGGGGAAWAGGPFLLRLAISHRLRA